MKIKTLVAVLLLSGGASSAFAQNDCNANSSISHEAVKAKNYKDAYAPCMAVLKDCPTLKYYTYSDAFDILTYFLKNNKDRNSADYKKYFDELMQVHDWRIQYIPEFLAKGMKLTITAKGALGAKAIDYLTALGMDNIQMHEQELTRYAMRRLAEVDGLRVFGTSERKDAVVSFLVGDIHHLDMGTLLDRLGIAVRTGHHCAQPLMLRLGIQGTVRASFALYNTKEEIDTLVDGIKRVSKMF